MAGLFLKLPERSPVIHPVMAPAGAPSSLTASREQGRKPTGATNLFAQLCLDWESDMQILHWTHPAAFKLPLNGKGKCWRKEVILTAVLAVFDLCHTVILGHCGPEMLRKQLLLSLSCGKCSLPAPHDCTWSRHGFRGHCAVWPLSCVCCGKQDPWKSYSPCRLHHSRGYSQQQIWILCREVGGQGGREARMRSLSKTLLLKGERWLWNAAWWYILIQRESTEMVLSGVCECLPQYH